MKTKSIFVIAAAMVFCMVSCEKNGPVTPENPDTPGTGDTTDVVTEGISGEVSGVWEAGSVINVTGHITVPEGQSLTIEEGVTVIFSDAGVGVNHTAIEFSVDGNLYCLGTEDAPVLLTVAEELRTPANTFKGLWGGIVDGANRGERLIDRTLIE